MGRRTFLKGLGASAAGAFALGSDHGTTATASADGALEIGLAASVIGGPALMAGWALREFNVIGSDPPAEGLTPDVLHQQIHEDMVKRRSNNQSTIVDNENILDGVEHNAYTEGKIAAIEELNAGSSESDVLDAARSTANSYVSTVIQNLIDSWNESALEAESHVAAVEAHSDLNYKDVYPFASSNASQPASDHLYLSDETYTLPDGTETTIKHINYDDGNTNNGGSSADQWDYSLTGYGGTLTAGLDGGDDSDGWTVSITPPDGWRTRMLRYSDWNPVLTRAETVASDVESGLSTWVTSVYGDVQSGTIEVSDLVTPKERAAMMAEEEGMSQAIADLVALNIPVDPDREATITIDDTGATLRGTFGLSDESDGPIENGTTYDPSTFTGDAYFTADMSLVEGSWDAFESGVDGGTITLTSEPYEGTAIEVTTTADETVTVPAADWSETDAGGSWEYDASGDLETTITEVSSARFHATATETQYETLRLESSFTVDELTDSDGESVDSTSFSSSEPQDDSNYITQDEWDQLEQQNQELIEKYEESQNSGGGAIDWSGFSLGGIPGEYVVGGVAVVAGYLGLTN